jgi:hypothetical protein
MIKKLKRKKAFHGCSMLQSFLAKEVQLQLRMKLFSKNRKVFVMIEGDVAHEYVGCHNIVMQKLLTGVALLIKETSGKSRYSPRCSNMQFCAQQLMVFWWTVKTSVDSGVFRPFCAATFPSGSNFLLRFTFEVANDILHTYASQTIALFCR